MSVRTTHLSNESIYHISSHAVARNQIFKLDSFSKRFLKQVDKYLSPLCDILHYVVRQSEYQLIVRLKSRTHFCNYYREKYDMRLLEDNEIPFSSHIFSQAMSNLLASTAIHFNRVYNRKGTLFAGRFNRKLIESVSELEKLMRSFDEMQGFSKMPLQWQHEDSQEDKEEWKQAKKANLVRSGFSCYHGKKVRGSKFVVNGFKNIGKIDLVAQFKTKPLKNIYSRITRISLQYYFIPPDLPPVY